MNYIRRSNIRQYLFGQKIEDFHFRMQKNSSYLTKGLRVCICTLPL